MSFQDPPPDPDPYAPPPEGAAPPPAYQPPPPPTPPASEPAPPAYEPPPACQPPPPPPAPAYAPPPAVPPPAYGAAPAYGATPAYGAPGYAPMQNGPGTTALVTGIVGLLCCGLLSIVAIITGMNGQKLAAQGLASNGGSAKAGLILGWIGVGLWILGVVAWIAIAVASSHVSSVSTNY